MVPEGVQTHHAQKSTSLADVLCPNVLELGIMAEGCVDKPADVLAAARKVSRCACCSCEGEQICLPQLDAIPLQRHALFTVAYLIPQCDFRASE